MPDGADRPALITTHGVTKRFPGVIAVNDVSIDVRAGEVLALTGENGSGKSTLAKMLTGMEQPSSGDVMVDGRPVRLSRPLDALRLGIGLISQELTLAPTLSVAENLFMGRLPVVGGRRIDWKQARAEAGRILNEMGVDVDPRRRTDTLSIEQQQALEIARAFSQTLRVLVLDEASSSLSEAAADTLLELIERKRSEGVSVVMITHRMGEIFRVADRATVLRDGRFIGTVHVADTTPGGLIKMMVGRDVEGYFGTPTPAGAVERVVIRDLATTDGSVQPVSLSIAAGEILGIAGLAGSGKSEFARALAGATASTGSVQIDGTQANLSSPTAALGAGVAYVPDDRKREGILPNRAIIENLCLTPGSHHGRPGSSRELSSTARVADDYGVVARSVRQRISGLSGGNQQKVVVARAVERSPDLLVLNEPTRGVDVAARADIYDVIRQRAAAGSAIVLVSSELPELLGLANRIAVFFERRVVDVVDAADATEQLLAHLCVAGRRDESATGEGQQPDE